MNKKVEFTTSLLLLIASTFFIFACIYAAWPFTTDDAYISLTYSKNLVEGHGLRWNIGEPPVEGYSNFLQVLIGAFFLWTGLEPVIPMKVLGTLFLMGTFGLTYLIGRPYLGSVWNIFPLVGLATYQGIALWTVSGLETPIYGFLFLGFFYCHFECLKNTQWHNRHGIFAGIFALAAGLTRIEFPLILLVTLLITNAHVLFSKKGNWQCCIKKSLLICAVFGIPYLLYFVWRLHYFGNFLPNTVICKSGFPDDLFALIKPFLLHAVIFLPCVLAPFLIRTTPTFVMSGVIITFIIMLFNVNPVVAHNNRHFLAVFPFLYIMGIAGYQSIVNSALQSHAQKPAVIGIACTLVALMGYGLLPRYKVLRMTSDGYIERTKSRKELSIWLNDRTEPTDWVLMGDIGIFGYYKDFKVEDYYCLNSKESANRINAATGEVYDQFLDRINPKWIVVTFRGRTKNISGENPNPRHLGLRPRNETAIALLQMFYDERKYIPEPDKLWYSDQSFIYGVFRRPD